MRISFGPLVAVLPPCGVGGRQNQRLDGPMKSLGTSLEAIKPTIIGPADGVNSGIKGQICHDGKALIAVAYFRLSSFCVKVKYRGHSG